MPKRRSLTLTHLYRAATGDERTHQRTIHALLQRTVDPRRRKWIHLRITGRSYHAIADSEDLTAATVRSAILSALEAIRKAAAGEPRYNKRGRQHTASPAK